MREAFILTGATGGILIACYDWRLLAFWLDGYFSPEVLSMGAPLVRDRAERERLWGFLRREEQRGDLVRVERQQLSPGRQCRPASRRRRRLVA